MLATHAVGPFDPYATAGVLQPEKRLMLAVLEGAVGDFQKYATVSTGRGRRIIAEADAWKRGDWRQGASGLHPRRP